MTFTQRASAALGRLGLLGAGLLVASAQAGPPPAEALEGGPASMGPSHGAIEAGVLAPSSPPPGPIPLAITVSGAVSLGAWQAGFLHYLVETIKRNERELELELVTGASAGTINALIAAMELSGEPIEDPRDSLFWALWNEFTYDEIFDVGQTDGPYLSSGQVLEELAGEVGQAWARGLDEDLDIVLGAAVTRHGQRRVELEGGLSVARSQEHFVLRIQGQGVGAPPRVSNYVDLEAQLPALLLPLDGEGSQFEVLTQLLLASSALPGAFEPQVVPYCLTPLAPGQPGCVEASLRAEFIDGAISDRYPLRLAWWTAATGMQPGPAGHAAWSERPGSVAQQLPEGLLFLYMDPMHASYPPLAAEEGVEQGASRDKLLSTFAGLVGDLAGSAQAAELYNLAEEHPELRGSLALVEPTMPPVSGELFKFFGFFDRQFRRYDFYLGMADARRFLERVVQPRVDEHLSLHSPLHYPEPEQPQRFWRPYGCIRAVVDQHDVLSPAQIEQACELHEDHGFEVLLQTSIDRVWDHCARLPQGTRTDHPLCHDALLAAGSLAERPRVPGVDQPVRIGSTVRRGSHESNTLEGEFTYLTRLLELYEFEYRDFGLARKDAWLGTTLLREEMGRMVTDYGAKLEDPGERLLVLGAGKPALNLLHYAAPATTVHVGMGSGVELGTSFTGVWMRSRWIRGHGAVSVEGLGRFLSSRPNVAVIRPMLGFEIEAQRLSGVVLQPRLVNRAGLQLSSADNWSLHECNTARFDDDSMICTVPTFQTLLALSVFERIRLQLGLQYDMGLVLGDPDVRDDAFTAVGGVGYQWISPFTRQPRHRRRSQRQQERAAGAE